MELIYTEHHAGVFENGLQICIYCAEIITDYSGVWSCSDSSHGPSGFPKGKVWITGKNPRQITTIRPKVNYGDDDPYTRKIIKCYEKFC